VHWHCIAALKAAQPSVAAVPATSTQAGQAQQMTPHCKLSNVICGAVIQCTCAHTRSQFNFMEFYADFIRWKSIFPDVLVLLVITVFGANVVQRVRHVTHKDHRHLWQILYELTGLLLDVAILALQALSKLAHCLAVTCN